MYLGSSGQNVQELDPKQSCQLTGSADDVVLLQELQCATHTTHVVVHHLPPNTHTDFFFIHLKSFFMTFSHSLSNILKLLSAFISFLYFATYSISLSTLNHIDLYESCSTNYVCSVF